MNCGTQLKDRTPSSAKYYQMNQEHRLQIGLPSSPLELLSFFGTRLACTIRCNRIFQVSEMVSYKGNCCRNEDQQKYHQEEEWINIALNSK